MALWVALLYSVVVTVDRRVTKADLLSIADGAGLAKARTVLSTGNLIFESDDAREALESRLEQVAEAELGRRIPIFCRTPDELAALVAENPFPAETVANPGQVAARIMRQMPGPDVAARIALAAREGEQFRATTRGLWISAPNQLSQGRLLSAVGARWVGEGTLRNASSLGKIAAALT